MASFFLKSLFTALLFYLSPLSATNAKECAGENMQIKRHRIAEKTHPVLENKPFVVIVLSYNNAPWIEKNLLSILKQDYDNYRIVYIDDASTDGSDKQIERFLACYDSKKRVTLLRNEENKGAMHNLYHAVHSCENGEIIVTVDGDDFLAHPHVLHYLNAYYANPDVWITYGNYVNYPFCTVPNKEGSYDKKRVCLEGGTMPLDLDIADQKGIRSHVFVTSHLRTFYAGLFKRIKLQDFLYKGEFLPMTSDVAYMLPMVELAGGHDYFIRDILYLYNKENPISDYRKDRKLQLKLECEIKSLKAYSPINEHPSKSFISSDQSVDLVVFSDCTPSQLYLFLDSCNTYSKEFKQIIVVYCAQNDQNANDYQKVKKAFPNAIYIPKTGKPTLLDREGSICYSSISPYVVFAIDSDLFENRINFTEGVQVMKQTGAHGVYYSAHLESSIPIDETLCLPLRKGVYAWQFAHAKGGWQRPSPFHLALFRKADAKSALTLLTFDSLDALETLLRWQVNPSKVGLYHTPFCTDLSLTDKLERGK